MFTKQLVVANVIISISGINTAWSSSKKREKGHLWLGTWQLENAIRASKNADVSILLSHHPSNWLNEFEENIVKRKIQRNFDFYLHGHEHNDWVTQIGNHVRISSGCCYESPGRPTGYSMGRLYIRDDRGGIYLRVFDDKDAGWIPRIFAKTTSGDGVWPLSNLSLSKKGHRKDTIKRSEKLTRRKRTRIYI